jgi:hypothetical protein
VSQVPGSSVIRVSLGECVDVAEAVGPAEVDGAAAVIVGVRVKVTVTACRGVADEQAATSTQLATAPAPQRPGLWIMNQR